MATGDRAFALIEVPKQEWPDSAPPKLKKLFRSNEFLVQQYKDGEHIRLTVCRTTTDLDEFERNGRDWQGDIDWEELQKIKGQCGFRHRWAVEVFPPERDVVNVASMRHLWVLPTEPPYGWTKAKSRKVVDSSYDADDVEALVDSGLG
ncbi:DUF7694 domain-containing protein [Rhodococcoides fascians]|uniref:DUF7694 domain-containing protein n=1 Tax=Rhodococcoides fascians TaxID=1828 RepID=UPI000689380D|nr:hypothetical protein [Rhodococcus fascians]